MEFLPQLFCIFLQDRLLRVQHCHVHLQVRAAGLLRLQDMIELRHLEENIQGILPDWLLTRTAQLTLQKI